MAESKIRYTFALGEMAEWSIAAVLKTVELRGSGGSNPSLSAINIDYQWFTKITPDFTPDNVKSGVFSIILLFRLKLKSNKGILKGKGHKLLS